LPILELITKPRVMSKKKQTQLSWDAFQALGNPENAPEEPKSTPVKADHFVSKSIIRVHLEKKGRGGKPVSIIKGLEMTDAYMKDIAKDLKAKCGVGGSQKNGEIILQGDQRDKIIAHLKSIGAQDIKKAGA